MSSELCLDRYIKRNNTSGNVGQRYSTPIPRDTPQHGVNGIPLSPNEGKKGIDFHSTPPRPSAPLASSSSLLLTNLPQHPQFSHKYCRSSIKETRCSKPNLAILPTESFTSTKIPLEDVTHSCRPSRDFRLSPSRLELFRTPHLSPPFLSLLILPRLNHAFSRLSITLETLSRPLITLPRL